MRISTDTADVGYREWLPRLDLVVTLDGVVVKDCDMADEELGYVRIAMRNENGDLYVVDDEIATEFKHGKVVINIPSGIGAGDVMPEAYYARLP